MISNEFLWKYNIGHEAFFFFFKSRSLTIIKSCCILYEVTFVFILLIKRNKQNLVAIDRYSCLL